MDAVKLLQSSPDATPALGTFDPEPPPGLCLQSTETDHHFHGPTQPDVATRRRVTIIHILIMHLLMTNAATYPAWGRGEKSRGLMHSEISHAHSLGRHGRINPTAQKRVAFEWLFLRQEQLSCSSADQGQQSHKHSKGLSPYAR